MTFAPLKAQLTKAMLRPLFQLAVAMSSLLFVLVA